jgi:hypothetical protein
MNPGILIGVVVALPWNHEEVRRRSMSNSEAAVGGRELLLWWFSRPVLGAQVDGIRFHTAVRFSERTSGS